MALENILEISTAFYQKEHESKVYFFDNSHAEFLSLEGIPLRANRAL